MASEMKLYSDLGKVAADMLSDDYASGKKVKLTSKTSDGISYTMSGSTSDKSPDLLGELNVKVKQKAATISAKLLTNADPAGEVKYERSDTMGRRGSVTLTASRSKAIAKSEIVLPRIGAELKVDAMKREVLASATAAIAPIHYGGYVILGAEGLYQASAGALSDTKLGASLFDGRESEIMVEMEGKADAASLSYSHWVRPGFSVAGKVRYDTEAKSAVADMGIAYKVDGGTMIKAKLNTCGMAALSYIQNVRPNTKLIMSSSFDVAKLDSAKVGFAITME